MRWATAESPWDSGGWGWGAVKVQRKCQVLNTMRVEPLGFIVGSDVDKRARGIKKDSQFWSEKPERVWSSLRWESGSKF